VLSNGGADDLSDGALVDIGDGFQLLGLVGGEANGHGFGGSHALIVGFRTTAVNHRDILVAWYHGCTILKTKEGQMTNETKPQDKKEHDFHIQIDRAHYDVAESSMTGAQLRLVPTPPIGSERDLFQVVPGNSDLKINDADIVQIHNGQRFFTAPAQINPGLGE